MLSGNAHHFTPTADQSAEPYVALRLVATVLTVLAAVVVVVGALLGLVVLLGSLGSAGEAARIAPGAVPAGIAGAGVLGGLAVLFLASLYALFLWATAQAIRVVLSIEARAREAAVLQRGMLAELRRINSPVAPLPH